MRKASQSSPWRYHHRALAVTVLSLSVALIVSLAPCCELLADNGVLPAHASAGDAGHDHGDDSGRGPCSPQFDFDFVPPDVATLPLSFPAAVPPPAVALPLAAAAATPVRVLSTHGPPGASTPIYLRFLRILD